MPLAAPRTRFNPFLFLAVAAVAVAVCVICASGQPSPGAAAEPTGVDKIRHDAQALAPTLQSELAKRYAAAAKDLPRIEKRVVYRHKTTRAWISLEEFEKLPEPERGNYAERVLDEQFYYNTGYGSPLSYSRAMDILAQHGLADVRGLRTLDFGCGGIGPMRLLAALGADAVGVDVEPLFPLLYNKPGDQGEVKTEAGTGRVSLITGRWPAEESARKAVGGGFDLIVSKNTLKMGYIHPERPVDKRMLVDLGVDDAAYVRALCDALKPGGRVLIYNICPHRSRPDEEYKPWSDGRCPFARDLLENSGFRVIAFDVDDSVACRAMARVLGWDKGANPMDLENDLFAHYTLLERAR